MLNILQCLSFFKGCVNLCFLLVRLLFWFKHSNAGAFLPASSIFPNENKDFMSEKRQDYLTWDEYFMGVACLSAQRSKDPSTQVGACVVNRKKKIVGIGYNGFPTGCSDDLLPWSREGGVLDTKYAYVCHAELNAILNSIVSDLDGCTLYVALFPCNECAKIIIQSGIREIVYLSDKYAETDQVKASKIMLEMAGVACRKLTDCRKAISLTLTE